MSEDYSYYCFICDRKLGKTRSFAITHDAQQVVCVGSECIKKIKAPTVSDWPLPDESKGWPLPDNPELRLFNFREKVCSCGKSTSFYYMVNTAVKAIDLSQTKVLVAEDLKNVKRGKRFRKQFSSKLQRWRYPKVLDKLSMVCEEQGVDFIKVNPAYTSQTCNECGLVDKNSRKLEKFECTGCGYKEHADYNAALNILYVGGYSVHAERNKECFSTF